MFNEVIKRMNAKKYIYNLILQRKNTFFYEDNEKIPNLLLLFIIFDSFLGCGDFLNGYCKSLSIDR